jgi:CRISPR-associated protein Cas2
MAGTRHLILIAYDISDNKDRTRVSDLLEAEMVRVQESLFEGWMTRRGAQRLADEAALLIDEGDSLRLYVVPRGGVGAAKAWGFPPAPLTDGLLII